MTFNVYDLSSEDEDILIDKLLTDLSIAIGEVLADEDPNLFSRMMRLWNDPERSIEVSLQEPSNIWEEIGCFIDEDIPCFEATVYSAGSMDNVALAKVLCIKDEDVEDNALVFNGTNFVWFPE